MVLFCEFKLIISIILFKNIELLSFSNNSENSSIKVSFVMNFSVIFPINLINVLFEYLMIFYIFLYFY